MAHQVSHREGDPEGRSTVIITALGSVLGNQSIGTLVAIHNLTRREEDPKGFSTVLVTALGSVWGNRSPVAVCTECSLTVQRSLNAP
jgi:hypothetical protein